MAQQKPNQKSSRNYLQQACDDIARQFTELENSLAELEKNMVAMFSKKVRESFKNGIEVGRKKTGQAKDYKEKPEK